MVTFLLSRSHERARLDWLIAAALDLTTIAWIGLLIAWVV